MVDYGGGCFFFSSVVVSFEREKEREREREIEYDREQERLRE